MRLVSRLLSGDARALDQFVQTYRRFITSILSRQPNLYPQDVEEVYQRFLLHIWEDGYRRLRPWRGTRSLRSYLGAIARNLARDYRRERHRNLDNAADCEIAVVPAVEMRGEWSRVGVLKAAMGKLSDRDRDLIHRRYYLEESYREIADSPGNNGESRRGCVVSRRIPPEGHSAKTSRLPVRTRHFDSSCEA